MCTTRSPTIHASVTSHHMSAPGGGAPVLKWTNWTGLQFWPPDVAGGCGWGFLVLWSPIHPGQWSGFPHRTGKPGKMGRYFPVREKSGNFEQTGKVRENHTKYWKTEINWDKYYLIFLVIFKWTVHFLVKWIKFSVKKKQKIIKNTGKMAKNTGKVREFCQSGKVGTLMVTWDLPVDRQSDGQHEWTQYLSATSLVGG